MILTIIESPFTGEKEKNIQYARQCVKDSLNRNEAPIASHLLYTQPGILDDDDTEERELGINAGLEWRRVAERTAVYTDLGISEGMEYGIELAKKNGIEIVYRSIYGDYLYDFADDLVKNQIDLPADMQLTNEIIWDLI